MAVDDPRPVQVVGGELAADAVAGEDADAKAAHLAGHVTEDDVIVVELDAEHRVGQRLDHLALEFDLVLLRHAHIPSGPLTDLRRLSLHVNFQSTSAPLPGGSCRRARSPRTRASRAGAAGAVHRRSAAARVARGGL